MKDRLEYRVRHPRKYDVWLFPFLTVFAVILIGILNTLFPQQWVSEPLRSAVESLGFLAGMSLGVLLLTQHHDDTDALFRVWVPTGLISMSVIGEFHSFLPFENTFVWLHSLAMLSGGLYFTSGLVLFKLRPAGRSILLFFTGTAALILGVISLSNPGILPQMLSGGKFTVTTIAMTTAGGLFFLIAAVVFFIRYLNSRNSGELLFACFSGLHSAAGISFAFELPWQQGWWLLHALSYFVLLGYTFTIFKQAEDKSRLTKESYQYVMETSMDGFFIADTQGQIIEVNDAYLHLTGYDRDEILRMKVPDIEAVEKPEEVALHVERIINNGSDRFETRHRRKNGTTIDIEANIHYLPGGRLFVFVHDISGRKKAAQQLIENDRLASLGLLVSGVTHEVGNPLTIIIGYSSNLLNAELPEEVKDGVRVINEESQRAADILRNLLTFARAEPQEKRLVSVNESIRRVLKLRTYDQKVNKICVNTLFGADLPKIIGNRSRLEQVFYNIIVNAEFSMIEAHQGGTLTVTTECSDNIIKAEFADNGTGISKENLTRIFTPFFTTKKAGQGTGLGLSVCQGIIAEHDGRIYAESVPGNGATFVVELPLPAP